MASFQKRGSSWRAVVRFKGVYKSATFFTKSEARMWASEQERAARMQWDARKNYDPHTYSTTGLVTPEEIINRAVSASSVCGVYFLIESGVIIYVGKSLDVFVRISEHRSKGRTFSQFHIIPCHPDDLDVLEARYIAALQPRGNFGRNGKIVLPIAAAKLQRPH